MRLVLTKRIIKRTRGLGNKRTSGDHPNYYIIEKVQNTEKSPGEVIEFIENTIENWRAEETVGEKLSWGKNPERDLAKSWVITITICNTDDATQIHKPMQTF